MRIAILGTGGAALGYAAVLASNGHDPVVYSFSGNGLEGLRDQPVTASGTLDLVFSLRGHRVLSKAIQGADGVIVASPANRHRRLFDDLAPLLEDGQHVLISAELSMSGQVLIEQLKALPSHVTVTSLATTLMLGRRTGASSVAIGGMRKACDAWSWPESRAKDTQDFWRSLFGDVLSQVSSHYTIALSNLNPPAHMANGLCNFTRIEKGEHWANYDGITESVARLMEGLDEERLAVALAYDVSVRSVETHYQLSFNIEPGMTLAQMSALVHERRKGPPGPTTTDTRFVTEDIPFGIAFVEHLGNVKGVSTPLHRAGVDIFSGLYGRDFRSENDLIRSN